jgi:mitogen-activated protein kinase kinase
MEQLALEQELGRGNYGTVKKVLHRPTNVEMAMKVRPLMILIPVPLFKCFFLSGNSLRVRLV